MINYSFKTFIIFVQDGLVLEDPNNEGAVALYPWDSWGEVLFVKHRDLDAPVILLAHPTENNAPELSISPELSLQQVRFQEGGGQPSYTEQALAFVTFGYSVLERYWETVEANREEPTNEIPLELFYILNTKGKDSDDEQTEEIKNGLYESFHKNGQLSKRENYKDGELDGLVEEFYENGQLNQRENYKDGELDGPWEWFYENGELMTRATFINGKKEGLVEGFHTNGQLSYRWNYKAGKPDGLEKTFDEDGRLRFKENYKNGKLDGLRELFFKNGQLKYRWVYKDGKEDGLWEIFNEDGQLLTTWTYKDGVRQ